MPRGALAVAIAIFAAGTAAAETSKSFEVTGRIVPGCAVITDGGGRWGVIDLGRVAGVAETSAEGVLLSAAGAGVSIECTPGVSASLFADQGDHPAGGERHLKRAGGEETIRYRLYADGERVAWSNAAAPLAFTGGRRTVPIRAIAMLAAPAAAGTYTDTVRVTLTW